MQVNTPIKRRELSVENFLDQSLSRENLSRRGKEGLQEIKFCGRQAKWFTGFYHSARRLIQLDIGGTNHRRTQPTAPVGFPSRSA